MLVGKTKVHSNYSHTDTKISDMVSTFDQDTVKNVISYNTKTQKQTISEITSTSKSSAKDFVYIVTEHGDTLLLTSKHKVYIPDTDTWILAQNITTSHKVLHITGHPSNIVEVNEIHGKRSRDVYTLTIKRTHNFYANNILVHNATGATGTGQNSSSGSIVDGARNAVAGAIGNPGLNTTSTTTKELKDQSWDTLLSQLPPGVTFYWQMLAPKKTMFSDTGELASPEDGGRNNDLTRAIASIGGYGPAPRLSPVHGNQADPHHKISGVKEMSTHVNIRDDHHWTESPVSSRTEVPMLQLREFNILMNPMLNQLLQNVGVTAGNLGQAAKGATQLGELLSKAIETDEAEINQQRIDEHTESEKEGDRGPEAYKNVGANKGLSAFDRLGGLSSQMSAGAAAGSLMSESHYSDPMNPYNDLYIVNETLFRYTIPYLQNPWVAGKGWSGANASGGKLADSLNNYLKFARDLSSSINFNKFVRPGRYIEEPQGFMFGGREREFTVTFPLFNTKSYAEIIKNWQFLFLLSYQNTPNRISRDLIDPPCIYEALIPGIWYSKYACISNLTVDFVGNRREMDLPLPFLDKAQSGDGEKGAFTQWQLQKRKIHTIIPDAYNVTITVKELFGETQNFMYQMLRESMNDKVTVTVK